MRRLLLLVVLLLLTVPAPAHAQVRGGPVVVVAVPGLQWRDVGPSTPALERLVADAAVGALSVKALPAISCPADGALTLGAGARAEAFGTPCGAVPVDRDEQRRLNLESRDSAVVGLLAERVRGAGGCVSARGALADAALPGPHGEGCPVAVVTGEPVGRPPGGARDAPRPAAAAADRLVAEQRAALPAGGTLLVVGLSGAPGDERAALHLAAAVGPAFPPGTALRSASTRRAPYVQLVDVAPTVLDLLGLPVPEQVDGEPWQAAGTAPGLDALVGLGERAQAGKAATVPFFVVLLGGQAALLVALRRRPRPLAAVALAGAAVPAASYAAMLVPWWGTAAPLAVLLGVTVVLCALGAAAASRTRCPAGWVAAGTALLLAVDLVTGARLQVDSPAGYSTLVAGRFAGIGNVALGVFAAGALLGTALLAGRRPLPVVVGAGLLAVAVDGAPPWGSDVGGVLALVPAFVVLGLLLTGTRVSALRLGLAGLVGAAVVTAFALADRARAPQDRTHLGRFVAQVRDGSAGEVLRRKAEAVLGLLFHSPVTALLPVLVVAAVVLVLRPPPPLARALDTVPGLRPALASLAVACAIGFAVNDSGAAVPAMALVLAVPVVVALTARAVGRQDAAGVRARPARRG